MVRALRAAGAPDRGMIVVGTPYGTNEAVRETLVHDGFDVRVPELTIEAYRREVERALDDIVARHRKNLRPVIVLDDGPLINFCKPAVDPLFSSAAEVWGGKCLAVVLTGMGCDGTRGANSIVSAGGAVIAQDEATSVVWGMPGSVAQAGLCASVLPLDQIAPKVIRLFSGGRS